MDVEDAIGWSERLDDTVDAKDDDRMMDEWIDSK